MEGNGRYHNPLRAAKAGMWTVPEFGRTPTGTTHTI